MRNAKDVSVAAIPRITEVIPLFRGCSQWVRESELPRSLHAGVGAVTILAAVDCFVPIAASRCAQTKRFILPRSCATKPAGRKIRGVKLFSVSSFNPKSQGRQCSRAKNHLLADSHSRGGGTKKKCAELGRERGTKKRRNGADFLGDGTRGCYFFWARH